ncbi:hypothetical protein VCHA53O466_50279 [Vibrio chagasii]|nr:hypothetical protein VCHA53O466_50279 [Vibrio chagasii]
MKGFSQRNPTLTMFITIIYFMSVCYFALKALNPEMYIYLPLALVPFAPLIFWADEGARKKERGIRDTW